MIFRTIYISLIFCFFVLSISGQGIPKEVVFEPDEGGYPVGYSPVKKLGAFDLSSTAANEPFRHILVMYKDHGTTWKHTLDYRSSGFIAASPQYTNTQLKANIYTDINEESFRGPFSVDGQSFGMNPIYVPDPNRLLSAQGQTFSCINAPFASVKIDNVDEASMYNFFLITEYEIDRRAKSIANPNFGYLRWDIETVPYESWEAALKGRQVWQGGKYRHKNNGGTDPDFRDMDDALFIGYVWNRWRYVFSELIYKTKLYTGSKVWMYGGGPLQTVDAFDKPQFDDKGNISIWWRAPISSLWAEKNTYNQRRLSEELDYMEPWDNVSDIDPFAILKLSEANDWQNTDLVRLKSTPKTNITSGKPTRFLIQDIDGTGPNNNRKVKAVLYAQDGSIRVADKPYKIVYYNFRGYVEATIDAGKSSVEFFISSPHSEDIVRDDDRYLIQIWNNLYGYRYIERQKLGFMNIEPSPRLSAVSPNALSSNDVFDQRVYDATIAFANLQNYGIVYWDYNMVGKVIPMVYESIALAHKKIAPYKTHIENQTLAFVGVSMDNGTTWAEAGFPTQPFQVCYNGWWMAQRHKTKQSYPMALATYNAQQKTILVAHLSSLNQKASSLTYKIKVNIPNVGTYTYDISSTKDLKYLIFKL